MAATLGLLIAGGRGERLRLGVPKALAPLAGRTLLERALATLRALCDELRVCAPAALALPVLAGERVDDPPGEDGALAALVAGLSAVPFARALALGVDLPLVRPRALAELGRRLGGAPAVVPSPFGRPQPLAAWYAPEALPPLAAALARGERALVPAVLALGPELLGDEALDALEGGAQAFLNVNTPEDMAEAARRLSQGGMP